VKVVFMTREYPPRIYGGAGVHVEHLVRAMSKRAQVQVHCFGERPAVEGNPQVVGHPEPDPLFVDNPDPAAGALQALATCLRFNARPPEADVVHCHTWYSHFGGLLARIAYGLPLVVTVHSLEPLRPWKREQLGRGYDLSTWVERTTLETADAVIAVSETDREEILRRFSVAPERLHAIPNGVDCDVYRPVDGAETLARHGIDAGRPFVLFLGRISRQKGTLHFLRAAELLPPEVGVVLCAASPDSEAIEREVEAAFGALRERRPGAIWIREMLPREQAVALFSEAAVFCCPSIYEPFGIINLEAMACETPVVGTAVGGIREVVVPEETGILVDYERAAQVDAEPSDPARLAQDLAAAIARLIADPALRVEMGRRGRTRVLEHYGWDRIAERVAGVYQSVMARGEGRTA
jgi:glycogen synthase